MGHYSRSVINTAVNTAAAAAVISPLIDICPYHEDSLF